MSTPIGYTGPGTYIFINVKTGTCLDLKDASPADNTEVNGVKPSAVVNNPAQIWLIADCGKGKVLIINFKTGSYLAAPKGLQQDQDDADNAIKARVTGQDSTPAVSLNRWTVKTLPKGGVQFFNEFYPNKVLDLMNGESADGTPVLVWTDPEHPGATNQMWTLKSVL